MAHKNYWYQWFIVIFKKFLEDGLAKEYCQVVELYECNKTGLTKAILKISERHVIEKYVCEIVIDNEIVDMLDHKAIRTLTYLATMEQTKPEWSIVSMSSQDSLDEYILEILSSKSKELIKKTPSELSKNKNIIKKFSSIDANRIGYLAGISDTVKEYELRKRIF